MPREPLVPTPARPPQRAVALVEFIRPVVVPGIGRVKRLVAGEPATMVDGVPIAPGTEQLFMPPAMYADAEFGAVVVGTRRYPMALVESYEFARAAR